MFSINLKLFSPVNTAGYPQVDAGASSHVPVLIFGTELGEMTFISLNSSRTSRVREGRRGDLLAEFSSIAELIVDIVHLSTGVEIFSDGLTEPLQGLLSLSSIVLRLDLSMGTRPGSHSFLSSRRGSNPLLFWT